MNKNLRKVQPTTFGSPNYEETLPANAVKEALMSPPLLLLPYSTGHTALDADACTFHVELLVSQQHEGKTSKAIGYWSKPSTDAGRKYDSTQLNLLAIL